MGEPDIGLQLQAFLESGILGVCLVDLNETTLSSAVSSLPKSFADRIVSIAGDVGEEATADSYVEAVIEKWGRLDISVQCAGINMKRAPMMEVPVDVLDRIWRVNVRGGKFRLHGCHPCLRTRRVGGAMMTTSDSEAGKNVADQYAHSVSWTSEEYRRHAEKPVQRSRMFHHPDQFSNWLRWSVYLRALVQIDAMVAVLMFRCS